MDKGKLKGHAALWVANIIWGLNAPYSGRRPTPAESIRSP